MHVALRGFATGPAARRHDSSFLILKTCESASKGMSKGVPQVPDVLYLDPSRFTGRFKTLLIPPSCVQVSSLLQRSGEEPRGFKMAGHLSADNLFGFLSQVRDPRFAILGSGNRNNAEA